jgi:hypothetical protein
MHKHGHDKRPNLRIHRIENGTEIQTIKEIIAENSPDVEKDMDIQIRGI